MNKVQLANVLHKTVAGGLIVLTLFGTVTFVTGLNNFFAETREIKRKIADGTLPADSPAMIPKKK